MMSGLVFEQLNRECFIIQHDNKVALPTSSMFNLRMPHMGHFHYKILADFLRTSNPIIKRERSMSSRCTGGTDWFIF